MLPDPSPADYSSPNARATFNYLCSMLPKPVDEEPQTRAERDRRAMDAVAALCPYDEFEARLAARIVAMEAQAADCLRLAGIYPSDPAEQHRCRAQAASMARQADSGLRALLRMRATRDKQLAESHPAALERAGYWFKPAAPAGPEPASSPPPAADADPPPVDIVAEADLYAAMYPDRVRRIRAAGGLPQDLDFDPLEPDMLHAIVHGTSARLCALDPAAVQ